MRKGLSYTWIEPWKIQMKDFVMKRILFNYFYLFERKKKTNCDRFLYEWENMNVLFV